MPGLVWGAALPNELGVQLLPHPDDVMWFMFMFQQPPWGGM